MHKASKTSTLLSSNRNTNNKTDMKPIYVLNGDFEEHLHPGILFVVVDKGILRSEMKIIVG